MCNIFFDKIERNQVYIYSFQGELFLEKDMNCKTDFLKFCADGDLERLLALCEEYSDYIPHIKDLFKHGLAKACTNKRAHIIQWMRQFVELHINVNDYISSVILLNIPILLAETLTYFSRLRQKITWDRFLLEAIRHGEHALIVTVVNALDGWPFNWIEGLKLICERDAPETLEFLLLRTSLDRYYTLTLFQICCKHGCVRNLDVLMTHNKAQISTLDVIKMSINASRDDELGVVKFLHDTFGIVMDVRKYQLAPLLNMGMNPNLFTGMPELYIELLRLGRNRADRGDALRDVAQLTEVLLPIILDYVGYA
jgi:hypothetical protein